MPPLQASGAGCGISASGIPSRRPVGARPVHVALAVLVLERLEGVLQDEAARAHRLEVARDALRGARARRAVGPLEQRVRAVAARRGRRGRPLPDRVGDDVAQAPSTGTPLARRASGSPVVLAALDPAGGAQPRGVVLAQVRQRALERAVAERVRARGIEAGEAEAARALDLALVEVPGRDAVGRVAQDAQVAEQLRRRVEHVRPAGLAAQPLVLALAPPLEHRAPRPPRRRSGRSRTARRRAPPRSRSARARAARR